MAAEEILTVTNAMHLKRGRRVPVAITEYGNYMKPKDWADPQTHYLTRTLGMLRIMMIYLDRPATVLTMQMHDMPAMAGGSFKFIRSTDPDRQLPTYYMYQLWRHFRGTGLALSGAAGPVKAMAALNGNTVVCMVFNDQAQPQDIEVSLAGVPDLDAAHDSARWQGIFLDAAMNRLVRARSDGRFIRAEPYSVYAFQLDVSEGWEPSRRHHRTEFFGGTVMNEFTESQREQEVPIRLSPQTLADTRRTRVRVGFLGSEPTDRITMSLGQDTYELAAGTYFQEVPLKQQPPPDTVLRFNLLHRKGTLGTRPNDNTPENRLRLSAAAIVIEH